MKHSLSVTLTLIFLFLAAQFIGLFITNHYLNKELPYNIERPELNKSTSFITVIALILIVTFIFVLLARFKLVRLWKFWFFLSVILTLSISLSVFMNQIIAFLSAMVLAFFKIFKRNLIIHNFTELFIYGAIAALFTSLFNILSISILLVLISIYDVIAVWKTKHMVKLAKFQTKQKLFAGFFIPYKGGNAILGGGDIGFTLLFSGVVLSSYGIKSLIIPLTATLALSLLFLKAAKKKFYPAMPFLTAGCFAGYLIILLI